MRFFTRSAWKKFDESSDGFFTVYSDLFTKLIDAEIDISTDPLERSAYPVFGLADASDVTVGSFYRFWADFKTRRHFSHVDIYDARNKDYNSWARSQIKKENDLERSEAKKEYSCNIRQLVKYLKRHDPRWMALHAKKAKHARIKADEEEKKRNAAKIKAVGILKEARAVEEERWRRERRARNANRAERRVSGLNEVSNDSASTDDGDRQTEASSTTKSNSKKEGDQNWYCGVCKKGFKSDQMHMQHMETKKHKMAVKKTKPKPKAKAKAASVPAPAKTLSISESEIPTRIEEISNSLQSPPSINDTTTEQPFTSKSVINLNFDQFESSSSMEETSNSPANKEDTSAVASFSSTSSDEEDEKEFTSEIGEDESEKTAFQSTLKLLNENQGKNRDTYQTNDKANRRAERKEKRYNRITKQTMEAGDHDTGDWGCKTCKKNFPTRNSLFTHIKNECTPAYK